MRDMSYFTKIDPINYEEIARDSSRHLRYLDYKYLKDTNFDNPKNEPLWLQILATISLIACFIVILFIA